MPGSNRYSTRVPWPPGRRRTGPAFTPPIPGFLRFFANLADLPPLFVYSAADDILADDSAALVRRAAAAGVAVRHRQYAGVWHGCDAFPGVFAEARQGVEDLAMDLGGV
ncbi:alpha/beta hydrolase fold domain-containing protein [Nocardia sp. NPDC051833]|uniref:alpha/beta hydrolase fold domain-containing protein n=1 Tax=Nocardia sp. NPDC051833 TaxID=3155674 RepID=UPI0034340F61